MATTLISSLDSFSEDAGNGDKDKDDKLRGILAIAENIADQCRVCWVNKKVARPHPTYRCPSGICTTQDWKAFKSDLPFPGGVLCYYCLALFDPPFNHKRAPRGTKQTPELCEHPDVLKELTYILYENQPLRERIFTKLGLTLPSNMYQYKRFIAKRQGGGIYGAYSVISTYLDIREEI